MICWPFFADQQINSKFVSEVQKIGIDMKDMYHSDQIVQTKYVPSGLSSQDKEYTVRTRQSE